jgi:hypothetical protein
MPDADELVRIDRLLMELEESINYWFTNAFSVAPVSCMFYPCLGSKYLSRLNLLLLYFKAIGWICPMRCKLASVFSCSAKFLFSLLEKPFCTLVVVICELKAAIFGVYCNIKGDLIASLLFGSVTVDCLTSLIFLV